MTNRYANNLIAAAKTTDNLGTMVPIPSTESQVRPLTALPKEKQAEARGFKVTSSSSPPGRLSPP